MNIFVIIVGYNVPISACAFLQHFSGNLFLLKFRIYQGRAESPMEHIAQGKRSDTLGFPHSRVSAPCKGKSFNPLC
ncbi:hypothetical protein, partial [Prevotellamassilia timonensis]|uniref:hypothetical protein n=1 Tax=Prevotellamassilia timonensis TaxID=1852370 RepID=UPI0030773F52